MIQTAWLDCAQRAMGLCGAAEFPYLDISEFASMAPTHGRTSRIFSFAPVCHLIKNNTPSSAGLDLRCGERNSIGGGNDFCRCTGPAECGSCGRGIRPRTPCALLLGNPTSGSNAIMWKNLLVFALLGAVCSGRLEGEQKADAESRRALDFVGRKPSGTTTPTADSIHSIKSHQFLC